MFYNSIFSDLKTSLKQRSSFSNLTTLVAFATIGSVASYYLFKAEDNKEEIEKLSQKLRENRASFLFQEREIKRKGHVERMAIIKEELFLKAKNECINEEMKKYNEGAGYFGNSYTENFQKCENLAIRKDT